MSHRVESQRVAQVTTWTRTVWAFLFGIALALFVRTPMASATTVVDGFETPTLSPFWSTYIRDGSITMTTAEAHSGAQSAQFSSFSGSINTYEQIFHNFSTPTYGITSVWFYDTGAGVSSSNYIGFNVNNQVNFTASLTTFDYGFQGGGPGRGDQYDYSDSLFVPTAPTGITRTLAWHQYTIIDTPQALTLMVDNTTVYTRAGGTPFTQVMITMNAPYWRPAWTAYYDDFSFQSIAAVPEPSTIALAGIGLACSGLFALRRRKKVASKL